MKMPLDDDYLVWLYSQVGSVDVRNLAKSYWKLMRFLYSKEFTWSKKIAKDANRASDGIDLRHEFFRQTNAKMDKNWLQMPCSVLEMMIAMSWKMEFDSTNGETQADWFWQMIDNLGLSDCNDAHPGDEAVLNVIINKLLRRDYAPNGAGGLFPLNNPSQDQREVELFYQAEAYLQERAPI